MPPDSLIPVEIPDEVRRFVLAHIHSIPHLEALLLVRSEPTRLWGRALVAERIFVDAAHGELLLADLAEHGLLVKTDGGSYRYAPGSAELAGAVERLAETHGKHLIPLTRLVHVLSGVDAHRFAGAFRVRRDR